MFSSSVVGRDGALVSSMLVVSAICQLNFSSAILRFLPIIKLSPSRVVLSTYALTTVASLAGATAFVLIAPQVSGSYRFLAHDTQLAVVYVFAVAAWGIFALQDSVLTALRRAPWVPLENGVFGVLKIAALPALLALNSQHAVFVGWVVPMVLLVIPVNWVIFRRMIPSRSQAQDELSPIERFGRRRLATFMLNDYVGTIFIQAGSTLLPVLVVGLIGTSSGAYFYIPFTIVGAFDLLFVNIAASMTVEASRSHENAHSIVAATVRKFTPLLGAGVIVLLAAASLVLLPYGHAYVHQGSSLLRLLALASVFRAVVSVYVAVCRIEGRAGRGMAVQGLLVVMTIGLTFAFARRSNVSEVGYAWLIANATVGTLCAPHLIRLVRAPAGHRIELSTQPGGV
jgi:O-antigen/teichoic acid export membrane protein